LVGTCASRLRQSPVSLDRLLKTPPAYFADFSYEVIKDPLVLKAQDGFLSVDLSEKLYGGVVYNDEWYPITKIDIHGPAEHLFKGFQNPVELQLVHRKVADPAQVLVISVLLWCERQDPPPNISAPATWTPPSPNEMDFNENIQKFVSKEVPYYEGTTAKLEPGLDLNILVNNPLVEGSGEYMNYRGSLTSPPCIDTVTWFVRRKTVIVSKNQVKAFMDALYRLTGGAGSYRAIMPMNRRFLKVFELRKQMNLQVTPYVSMPWSDNPQTDGEMQAVKMAKIANQKAEHTAYYARGFARRLKKSDIAWAKEMQGGWLSDEENQASFEAKQKADRDVRYAQSVRRVREAVQGAARGVAQVVDSSFRAQAQTVYQDAQVQSSLANNLFNGF